MKFNDLIIIIVFEKVSVNYFSFKDYKSVLGGNFMFLRFIYNGLDERKK